MADGSGRGSQNTDGRWLLRSAIASLPLPTSPPPRSSRGVLGLHLIQSVLRLEHVDRVSERLSLVDATHLARNVDIDVNIDKLPDGKEAALTVPALRADTDPLVWVPVSRHPRVSLGPLELRDADQGALTRLSSRETNRLVAAGMIRLFNLLLTAEQSPELDEFRGPDRVPRWLVEAAILALVEDGRLDWPSRSDGSPAHDPLQAPARAEAARSVEVLLAGGVHDPRTRTAHPFFRLLSSLTVDQVIVALLPASRRQTRIAYEAPELGGLGRTPEARSFLPQRDITVEYGTTIPADVDSFHVTVMVPPEMEVRRFIMVSDADENAVAVLRSDLLSLLGRLPDLVQRAPLLVRFEVGGILSRLDELARRRAEDYAEYQRYLLRLHRRLGLPLPRFPKRQAGVAELPQLLRATPGSKWLVSALREMPNGVAGAGAGLEDDPALAGVLTELFDRIENADLGQDLHLDNDPRENAGHIQWRRHATGLALPSEQAVRARVFLSITDSNPSAALQVLGFTALNLALVLGLVLGTSFGPDPEAGNGQSEVLVTLLLLVPGLLLSRLGLAPRRSVLARIRAVPRLIAWGSVVVNTLLAVWIVVGSSAGVPPWGSVAATLTLAGLGVLTLAALVHVALGWASRWVLVPPYQHIPRWLRNEVRRGPLLRNIEASVRFVEEEPVAGV